MSKVIVVTGTAGFIGSCMVKKLNEAGITDILCVDDYSRADKNCNLDHKQIRGTMHRDQFIPWLERAHGEVEAIIHLGARTDTTEKDKEIFDKLNYHYSQGLWILCSGYEIPLLYASSAATYGAGELGYSDSHEWPPILKPLNPYGDSKNDFDIWALEQDSAPPNWYGFKFFNVYGPNEYHKGRMASVIFHTVQQIRKTGKMKLFKSHRPDFADGHQSRDFIYVKDVVDMLYWFLENKPENGLYNVGTGKARTFLDLATNTFLALGLEPNIEFVDTPEDIRDTYQYFTEADMSKVRATGFRPDFHTLEDGIADYIGQYLSVNALY